MDLQERPVRPFRPGAVVGGVVLLALGVGLLLERSGVFALHHVVAPFVLIGLGAATMLGRGAFACSVPGRHENDSARVETRRRRGPGGGLGLILFGIWILISQNNLWGFTVQTSWPLLIVYMGVMMVVQGWR
jgi:hypothetical protein